VEAWIAAMAERDFVIGTRFHGAMAALLAGTPALVICHDSRTTEMCRFLGVPNTDLATFNASSLDALFASVDLATYHSRRRVLAGEYVAFLEAEGLKPRGDEEAAARS